MGKVIINKTDFDQQIELTTNSLSVSGGWYDKNGNYTSFSGGGGGSLDPAPITITYVNNSGSTAYPSNPSSLCYENDKIVYKILEVETGETVIYSPILYYDEGLVLINPGGATVSDLVNCTYDAEEEAVFITDPTAPSSATFTVS